MKEIHSDPVLIRNLASIQETIRTSPKQTYSVSRKNMTDALGGSQDGGVWNGGYPFDVEHVVIPAGKKNFPLHAHSSMWEFYWILSGSGFLRTDHEEREIVAGDSFMCSPGQAHQLIANETHDLVYVVVSNNVMADLIYYPDSKKWNAKPGRHVFREIIDYYDGEVT
jgi:uncharacterized cupin superfamily protein